MTPVSVNLIVKNCATALDACLASLDNFVADSCDEIVVVDTGSTDNSATVDTARRHGARVIERPDLSQNVDDKLRDWLPHLTEIFETETQTTGGIITDFAAARDIAMRASRHDCVFWIDSDDTLWEQEPGMLRRLVEQGFAKRFDCLSLGYEYSFDEQTGACTAILERERIVDRKMFRWQGRCHEILIPIDADHLARFESGRHYPIKIRHTAHRKNSQPADIRNYLILRSELEDDLAAGRNPDIRSRFYLGNACRGLGLADEALEHYQATFELSPSADNRYAAQLFTAEIHLAPPDLKPRPAVEAGNACVRMAPNDARGHYILSRAYGAMEQWEESLRWFESGRSLSAPDTSHMFNPQQLTSYPLLVAIVAALRLDRLGYARSLAEELRQLRPDWPKTHEAITAVKNAFVVNR